MRLIKLGLISVLGLFTVIFLLSILIPSQMRVSRAITINAPVDSVRHYIEDMRNWQQWNALLNKNRIMSGHFEKNSFSSPEVNIRMLPTDNSGLIRTEWARAGQKPVRSDIAITMAENAVIVQWYFDFKVKWYPWEKFGSIVFDKELGPPMENSLDQLKKMVEKTN